METEYKTFFAKAPEDTKFKKDFKYQILTDLNEIDRICDVEGKNAAFDTETNGLSFYKHHVVGMSFSFDRYSGFYVPLRHLRGTNAPIQAVEIIKNKLLYRNKILMFNAIFDLFMMEPEGVDFNLIKFFDVNILAFNSDTNIKENGLKPTTEWYLGRKVPTFEETMGNKLTIDQLTPEETAYYASCDSANTLGVFEVLFPILQRECPMTLKIDNGITRAMMDLLRSEIHIDSDFMKEMEIKVQEEIQKLQRELYKMVGYPFDLNSNRQVSNALLSLGVDTGQRTKTGDLKLGKEVLAKMDHPACKIITKVGSLQTQVSSYIHKLSQISSGRVNYQLTRVPTGRLASGNKDNDYFLPLNFQNLTKPKPAYYQITKADVDTGDTVCGYKFDLVQEKVNDPNIMYSEGLHPNMNVRRAISVPNRDEWYFLSMDYVQEELFVAAFLSKEVAWVKAFLAGEDIHKATAIEMFGIDAYNSSMRKLAKFANFGLLYGGNAFTLNKTSGLPMDRCEEIVKAWWAALRVLKRWKQAQISTAYRRGGCTYTAFGRPRRLGHYLSSHDWKDKAFGERSVGSHQIQGTCGDVIRIVLTALNKQIFRKYPEQVKFVGSIHDEVNYYIRKDALHLIPDIRNIMQITIPGFAMPLMVDISLGYSYGELFKFEATPEGGWMPVAA